MQRFGSSIIFDMFFGGEVDESPVFEEGMDADEAADIACQVLPAEGGR